MDATRKHLLEDAIVPRRHRIVYLTPDCTDAAVKKRAHGFTALGHELVSFSFRRARYDVGYQPDWPNVELGQTEERRLASRIVMCLGALRTIYANRRKWREATMLYVRNVDLSLLGVVGKWLTRSRAPLVYEVLDVHPALTQHGVRAAVLRWLERRVLGRSELLVISSPAFLRDYFQPTQHYTGRVFLLENKWPREDMCARERKLPFELDDHEPVWTIGWFGNLRCQKSLDILTGLAEMLPDRVRIYLRGHASLLGERTLLDAIRGNPNMVYEGEYSAPKELAEIYSRVHFSWCGDLCGGENSLWLLPCRLYEGGYFGIPAIAVDAHETGRAVRDRELGISISPPYAIALKDVLLGMTSAEYTRMRNNLEAKPASDFLDDGDLASMVSLIPRRNNE